MNTSLRILKASLTLLFSVSLVCTSACETEYIFLDAEVGVDEVNPESLPTGAVSLEGCAPHFVVRYFENLDGQSLVSVAGASCQPDVEVSIWISLKDGTEWEESRQTMPREEGYFVVSTSAGRLGGGITETDEPVVCLTIGEDAPICPDVDEEIPWGRG